jgi:hypothetical protein
VTSHELLQLLREFHRDRLVMYKRHVAAARAVGNYDFNNTYQYIIAREDMHIRWVADAITAMGGEPENVPEPGLSPSGKGEDAQRSVIAQDSDEASRFLDKWRPRVERVTHARHRNMLRVILGETLEHRRFFEQALAGRSDLLGRRADGAGTAGVVLPTRMVD